MIAVSAPGKLILAGEYAVLRGGRAVVAAVHRRVVVRVDDARGDASGEFIAAARDALLAAQLDDAAAALRRLRIDSSQLRDAGGVKLGLGSSAAVTVAAIAAALVATGASLDRERIHTLARAAHAAAQAARGAAGSGVDISASTFGGILSVRGASVSAVTLPALTWMPLWTGHAADTVTLVAAVEAARLARPAEVEPALTDIAAAADALAAASDPASAIAAVAAGGAAIARLSAAAGVDLETTQVRAARELARSAGGAIKTCGAGGGDLAIAALPPGTDLAALSAGFVAAGCQPLSLPFDFTGVELISSLRDA